MADEVQTLLTRADDVVKAAPARRDPSAARKQALELLAEARERLLDVADTDRQLDLAEQVARRIGDLEAEELETVLAPSPGVARAPTHVDDPGRVPPGQHLTAGWPVLHVSAAPDIPAADWRVTITGRVEQRLVLDLDALRELAPTVERTSDLHCVTGWTRLDNAWTGVRVADLLATAGPKPAATHAVAAGHRAYTANLPLDELTRDDALLAWAHDGAPLVSAHGGPLRLVIPALYGWKSVKWVTELRLVDRDVPGYWEERGYHHLGAPWRKRRLRGDGV